MALEIPRREILTTIIEDWSKECKLFFIRRCGFGKEESAFKRKHDVIMVSTRGRFTKCLNRVQSTFDSRAALIVLQRQINVKIWDYLTADLRPWCIHVINGTTETNKRRAFRQTAAKATPQVRIAVNNTKWRSFCTHFLETLERGTTWFVAWHTGPCRRATVPNTYPDLQPGFECSQQESRIVSSGRIIYSSDVVWLTGRATSAYGR